MYSNRSCPATSGERPPRVLPAPDRHGPFTLSPGQGPADGAGQEPALLATHKPHLDTVTFTTVPDSNARVLQSAAARPTSSRLAVLLLSTLEATSGIKVDLFPSTLITSSGSMRRSSSSPTSMSPGDLYRSTGPRSSGTSCSATARQPPRRSPPGRSTTQLRQSCGTTRQLPSVSWRCQASPRALPPPTRWSQATR